MAADRQSLSPASRRTSVAVGNTDSTLDNNIYAGEIGWSYPTPVTPAGTLNYGSSSYSKTGTWSTNSGGFSGSYGTAASGASATSTWTSDHHRRGPGVLRHDRVRHLDRQPEHNATNRKLQVHL